MIVELNGIKLKGINKFIDIANQDEFADNKEYMFELELSNDRKLKLQAYELRIIRRIDEHLERRGCE